MTAQYLLAIDCGTQSIRALLFDLEGNLAAKSQIHITPYHSSKPGWTEQDPEYYWQSIGEACSALWANTEIQPSQVAGVSATTQRNCVIAVDEQGDALRDAIVWMDARRTEGLKPVGGLWGLLFKIAGAAKKVEHLRSEAESHWIKKHEPEIWAKTHKLLYLSGFLNKRLTGRFVDSTSAQPGYGPFDYKKQAWAGKHHWGWKAMPITPEILPELVQPATNMGGLLPAAAEHLGIPANTAVIASGSDKACEILGAGSNAPHVGCMSFGTQATFACSTSKYIEVTKMIPPFPSAIPNEYHTEVQVYRGFWMVSWFKQQFGLKEQQKADERGMPAEALFDEMIADVPPGSMGLTLQPYWTPGAHEPGPEAKGSVIGFGDVHTRAHLYRAILEGLIYALRDGKEKTEKRSGIKITELRISGGGSQSDMAMQISADIMGMPAVRPHVFETSGLGAAIDIAVGLDLHPNFDTAVSKMTRTGDVFLPNPDNVKTYDQLFNRVYKQMYGRLMPLYKDIQEITGYPA